MILHRRIRSRHDDQHTCGDHISSAPAPNHVVTQARIDDTLSKSCPLASAQEEKPVLAQGWLSSASPRQSMRIVGFHLWAFLGHDFCLILHPALCAQEGKPKVLSSAVVQLLYISLTMTVMFLVRHLVILREEGVREMQQLKASQRLFLWDQLCLFPAAAAPTWRGQHMPYPSIPLRTRGMGVWGESVQHPPISTFWSRRTRDPNPHVPRSAWGLGVHRCA